MERNLFLVSRTENKAWKSEPQARPNAKQCRGCVCWVGTAYAVWQLPVLGTSLAPPLEKTYQGVNSCAPNSVNKQKHKQKKTRSSNISNFHNIWPPLISPWKDSVGSMSLCLLSSDSVVCQQTDSVSDPCSRNLSERELWQSQICSLWKLFWAHLFKV